MIVQYRIKCPRCFQESIYDFDVEVEKPVTNADRIRAMTDEELAQVLRNPCDNEHIPAEWCRSRGCGYQCSLDWLKQEATE